MATLPKNDICDTEMVIRIREPAIPTFEFVDLPGLLRFLCSGICHVMHTCVPMRVPITAAMPTVFAIFASVLTSTSHIGSG